MAYLTKKEEDESASFPGKKEQFRKLKPDRDEGYSERMDSESHMFTP